MSKLAGVPPRADVKLQTTLAVAGSGNAAHMAF